MYGSVLKRTSIHGKVGQPVVRKIFWFDRVVMVVNCLALQSVLTKQHDDPTVFIVYSAAKFELKGEALHGEYEQLQRFARGR